METVVLIPARGGSKGVPGKNIRQLNGKPLIHYTIEAARSAFDDRAIFVSSDDPEVISVAEQTGLKVPFTRPAEFATDTASSMDVITHLLNFLKTEGKQPELLVLLQPTSPFRTAKHIQEALALFSDTTDMVVSVKGAHGNPYFSLFEEDGDGYLKLSKSGEFTRRQDCPAVWEYNGAIYIIRVSSLIEKGSLRFDRVVKYVMDDLSSHDIDTPFDWRVAELISTDFQQPSKQV